MPFQNRVTPFSAVEFSGSRGQLMGNRGCLHNEQQELVTSRWRGQRWISCLLEYKGRKRPIMSPGKYTELFFLDEAVAFAAGHRPCQRCRGAAFKAFIQCWEKATGLPALAKEIDKVLHQERLSHFGIGEYQREILSSLPDGAFFTTSHSPDKPLLIIRPHVYQWSHSGYQKIDNVSNDLTVTVLTPQSLLSVLRAGYRLELHPSLGDEALAS